MNNCVADTLKTKDCICKFLQNIDDSAWIAIIHDAKSNSNITYDVIQKSQLYYSVLRNPRCISECITIADDTVTNIFDCTWLNDKVKYILTKYKSAIDKENCLNVRTDNPTDLRGFGLHFKMVESSCQDTANYGVHFKMAEGSSQDIKDIIFRNEMASEVPQPTPATVSSAVASFTVASPVAASSVTENVSTPSPMSEVKLDNDSMWCNII